MMSYKASLGHVVDRAFFHSEMRRIRDLAPRELESGCEVVSLVSETSLFQLP